jgi:hypothetical protein
MSGLCRDCFYLLEMAKPGSDFGWYIAKEAHMQTHALREILSVLKEKPTRTEEPGR